MKVIYGISHCNQHISASVVAIGVFDSVHRGHQKVISRAVSEAKRLGVKSVVLTFDPHPISVLHPDKFRSYVLTLDDRLEQISLLGVDICCVARFNSRLARLSPDSFIEQILLKRLKAQKIVVGEDFHFGCHREGDFSFLEEKGKVLSFHTEKVTTLVSGKDLIKTTYIKNLIIQGKLYLLKRLLARPYSLKTKVVKGEGRGHHLGYPTANLCQENVIILPSGIYCARVFVKQKTYDAVFYIGHKPSFGSRKKVALEAHLFHFKGDLYGQVLRVDFLKKIRNDKCFSDEKFLISQMHKDVLFAKKFFQTHAF